MLVTQAVDIFFVNNAPQIEALIFLFFCIGHYFLSNLAQMWRQLWLKMVKKGQSWLWICFSRGPKMEKSVFFSFLIKLNIGASIWGALFDKKNILQAKNHVYLGRSGLSTWKYQFSYDHWSQATSSSVSTWMGHCSSVAWVLLLTLKVG